jgi:hypothetical protein
MSSVAHIAEPSESSSRDAPLEEPSAYAASSFSYRADIASIALLLVAAVVVSALAIGDITAYIRGDWPTMFLPFYSFLGDRLSHFDIPGWNPYQFSGLPFAGDPSSGWGYLPAMLVFALLQLERAIVVFIGFHVALSAVAAYVLARLTGLGPAGALVTGTAYAFPWLIPAASGMVLFFQVTTWLPIALIGIELARRPGPPPRRFGGLVLSGLAISQILASWLGQGAYYALLVIAGWVAWRTLVTPPLGWTIRQRLAGVFGIGGGILVIGLAFNASALLIRLDVNARSSVAGGVYSGLSGWAGTKTGSPLDEIIRSLVGGFSEASWQYVGAAVAALAILAPFVAPRWPPLVFWFIVAMTAVVLALPETPLHTVMYALLPRFEMMHAHLPIRVLLVVPLAAAMLAGAAADALARGVYGERWLHVVDLVALVMLAVLLERQGLLAWGSLLVVIAIVAIATVTIALPGAVRPALVALALAAVVLWDPTGRILAAGWGPGLGPERSLDAATAGETDQFLYQNGAARFLAAATRDHPGRYAGYDPALLPDVASSGELPPQAYRNHWLGPANWLLVQNWGTWFNVEDVQGYNPVQVQRYVEYIDALNGHRQEYHEADVFPSGLASPLLDLLNLRYLIVPAAAPERDDLAPLVAELPEIYADDHVRILENADAAPRAWLVHEAQQVAPGEALPLLADGAVDPRQTALLEAPPPSLSAPPDPATESVRVVHQEPDRIRVETAAAAPALLVLSDVWDPGWNATVDGAPAPIYLADHVMRAVPVPAGEHAVEMRYDPPSLRFGLAVTLLTIVLVAAISIGLLFRERRHRAQSMRYDA